MLVIRSRTLGSPQFFQKPKRWFEKRKRLKQARLLPTRTEKIVVYQLI